MDRVFYTNSGAEAIEGALKAAKKYAYLKNTMLFIIKKEHFLWNALSVICCVDF